MELEAPFQRYRLLAEKADHAFAAFARDRGDCMSCGIGCSDCCHAVFGLFLVEAAHLNHHFSRLPEEARQRVLTRTDAFDDELDAIQKRLSALSDDPRAGNRALACERIRCPLLDDDDRCALYPQRPITCRVYGIPTLIQGRVHLCNRNAQDASAPDDAFDLDGAFRALFLLSREMLADAGHPGSDRASLLISVSRALRAPVDTLIGETFS
jgi:Fe-S-cluster containining protein